MITRRRFLSTSAAVSAAAAKPAAAQSNGPNIIFILADDLGYGDLGCYGQKQIATPNIDRLAAEGMRFTQAYAGSTVCAPSRCCLMTGMHTGHARIRGNKNPEASLVLEDVTVGKALQRVGYRTALIGKWGLGGAGTEGKPNTQGFDEFFGYLNQTHAHTSYPDHLWENNREYFLTGNFGVKHTQYSNDLFTDRALGFIEKSKDRPFFLYLAYTIPHANNELTRETGSGMEVPSDEPYTNRAWKQVDKNFAASITRLDRDVGRLMAHLAKLGIEDRTLVIFTSDNGPHHEGGQTLALFDSNGPLRGMKRDLYEGGIRVPAIARWKDSIEAGQTSDAVWAFWDFLPTVYELAGFLPRPLSPPLDGISIVPALEGKPLDRRDPLYWEFHEGGFHQAIRTGNWKGVRRNSRRSPIELYDLAADLAETRDVAASHSGIVARIARMMDEARTESADFPVKET